MRIPNYYCSNCGFLKRSEISKYKFHPRPDYEVIVRRCKKCGNEVITTRSLLIKSFDAVLKKENK